MELTDFWAKIFGFKDDNPQWNPALLIIEICMCAPISIASLERLFNQMNIVKPNVRSWLTNPALNAFLRIKVSKVFIDSFHKNYVSSCVHYWFKEKGWRIVQGKRKR